MKFRLLAICTVILCSAFCAPLQAQSRINGRILDAKQNEPLPFATMAVLTADSSVLTGAVADENGQFTLELKGKNGQLASFSCIGYTTEYRNLNELKSPVEVALKPTATMLEAVQVTAKAPVIEQQMDKLVMNVAQSAFAQGNNAEDLLKKAPGVSIDKDGNVKLNGQAVAVWIDGRPSQLDGKSLQALLKATDGNSIDKIEVMANPSAKYDAEGQGGIINIKTKHNFMQGFNGSLNANAAGMGFHRDLEMMKPLNEFYFNQEVSLNLNYRSKKTNSFLQVTENTNELGVDVISKTDLNSQNVNFLQKTVSRYNANVRTLMLKLGNDWFINDKNTLGFIVTLPWVHMLQGADTNGNRSYQQVGNNVSQQAMSFAQSEFNFTQYMGNLNYTHTFDAAKQSELTANLDYVRFTNNSGNPVYNYYLKPSQQLYWRGDSIFKTEKMDINSDRTVDIYSAKVDWQSIVMKMFMMEAGAKWAMAKTDNTEKRSEVLNGITTFDNNNHFDYTENISAVYATLAGMIPGGFTAKIGLRGEYTYAFNNLRTIEQNYFDVFPTAYVGWNSKNMMKRLGLSYTRRIQRPNYSQLNPFEYFIDAHTSNTGNPNLKPSYGHMLNLNAGFGQYVTLNATFMYNNDVIGFTPQIDPITGDQKLYADNIGENILYGGSATLSELPLGKMLSLTMSAQLYDVNSKTPNTILLAGMPNTATANDVHSLFVRGYGCLTLILPKDWKLQLDGYVTSPITQGYMHIGWRYSTNFAVKKTALDGRLVASLSLNDIFRTENNSFGIYMNGTEVSVYDQTQLQQTVKVGLQWNFGTAQKPLKHRKVGELEEASRTANTTGIN